MDKSQLKFYAVQARRELLKGVRGRLQSLGLEEEEGLEIKEFGNKLYVNHTVYPIQMKETFMQLQHELNEKGVEQVVDDVAFTWFNRVVAMRYMELNGYTSETDFVIDSKGVDEATYRLQLLSHCYRLHTLLPFLFEKELDSTALLLPDNLVDEQSFISRLIQEITPDNFFEHTSNSRKKGNVEVVGWLFQYYMTEKKAEVGGLRNTSVQKENLPYVTQLFTPKWIVKYMIENSLGKLYDEAYKGNQLSRTWDYYIKSEHTLNIVTDISCIEDIKIIDPACGTGHILTYVFDFLYDMYEERGYAANTIPSLILKKNLFGLDIDKRALKIAKFALAMKVFEKKQTAQISIEEMNIYEIIDTDWSLSEESIHAVITSDKEHDQIRSLQQLFQDGKQFGTLLKPPEVQYRDWIIRIESLEKENKIVTELKDKLLPLFKQGQLLSNTYDVVVTNPPYHSKYNAELKAFMKKEYNDYKSDLYSAFIYRTINMTKANGYASLMTPFTWMFISTHEKLRNYITKNQTISSLIQLEYSAYKEATVPICSFVIQNQKEDDRGEFLSLTNLKGEQSVHVKKAMQKKVSYRYRARTKDFSLIPTSSIAYWISDHVKNLFLTGSSLSDVAEARKGLDTGNNERFLRMWYEISFDKFITNARNSDEAMELSGKWFPYNKGGEFRKWYGNQTYVINYENNGDELRKFQKSNLRSAHLYFQECVTWSSISSSYFGARFSPHGFLFDNGGSSIFAKDINIYYLSAFLASKVSSFFLAIMNPTLNCQPGNVGRIPYIKPDKQTELKVIKLAKSCIHISKQDWDCYETSWGFKEHPFITYKNLSSSLKEIFQIWHHETDKRFCMLKDQEEEINQFISFLYGLESDVVGKVVDSEVTIRRADATRDAKSFLSYFVGCVMGRYSIDVNGVAFAGGGWKDELYPTFKPNKNGTINLTEELIIRLREFLVCCFGESSEDNIEWLAQSLYKKDNETAAERLGRYFRNEFFNDHVKVYQKRPIYWLIDSGKEKAVQILLYIHCYKEDTLQQIQDYCVRKKREYEHELEQLRLSKQSQLEKKKQLLQKKIGELDLFQIQLTGLIYAKVNINLDEGVQRNFRKLQSILRKC
ncbi:BREX-1 system adenine-specific DNA-methyltransferase PglX [Bacillus sp. FJAT-45350]|uniref:BREX-1 system adenine-specific DNA-methyltransferase PglX n=1 Tax=Bacillus sp. FJAT-45350 TaxID=2011014 RepID=UPI0015C7CC15|nr:BREX-1 system adenine-specific DNA-methyltransferase PglX [Bacillus sp. FJAT-45350]